MICAMAVFPDYGQPQITPANILLDTISRLPPLCIGNYTFQDLRAQMFARIADTRPVRGILKGWQRPERPGL